MDSQRDILIQQCTQVMWDSLNKILFRSEVVDRTMFRHLLRKHWKQMVSGGDTVFDMVYKEEEEFLYGKYTEMYLRDWFHLDGTRM